MTKRGGLVWFDSIVEQMLNRLSRCRRGAFQIQLSRQSPTCCQAFVTPDESAVVTIDDVNDVGKVSSLLGSLSGPFSSVRRHIVQLSVGAWSSGRRECVEVETERRSWGTKVVVNRQRREFREG